MVLGAALGLVTDDGVAIPALVVLLVAWALALAAFVLRRRWVFLVATSAVFLSASWALSVRATGEAIRPPLRVAMTRALDTGLIALEGRLAEDAAPGESGIALRLQVDRWTSGGETRTDAGGARVTVGGTLGLADVGDWRAGRAVRVTARLRAPGRYLDPGVPDGRLALARKGVSVVGSVKSGALVEVRGRGSAMAEAGARVRELAREAIRRHVGRYDTQSAAIVIAILIGDRVGLDDDVQRRLQEAGTYHVIAISGGNIAILAGVILWLLRVAGAGHRAGSVVTMGALIAYAGIVGGGASVVRATVMAVIYLAARQADHRSSPLNALAVTGALILLVTPEAVVDVAFWLTFGATLGILVGASLAASWPRARWLRVPLALGWTSVCAELALLPVAARVFARVTFAGLGLNFIAIPLMGVAQVAGMVTVPASWAWSGAADACGFLAYVGAAGLVRSAALVDVLPWLSYRLPPPHWIPIAGYYFSWAMWLAGRYGSPGSTPVARRWRRMRLLGVLGVAVCGAWILVEPVTLVAPGVRGRLRVTVLDVGHGDAVLVQLPDRRSLLVDTGGSLGASAFDIGGRIIAPALWALGTRRLDVLVLTHGDPDHVGGAASVVRDFRPREIWEGVPVFGLKLLLALKQQAAAARIAWTTRRAGEVIRLGEVTIRVWHPPPPDWERPRVRNDDSIVMDLRYGRVSVVLPGDIGRDVERTLVSQIGPATFRVVKVPHHGSSTSSSSEFVAALRPDLALLSAGVTTRVSDDVLRRYRDIGARLYRTDVHGAITMETDGRNVTVNTVSGDHRVFTK